MSSFVFSDKGVSRFLTAHQHS